MDFTDYLGLNELKIFKNVRSNLPKDITKTSNLLTLKDNVIYAWNYADNCVLTLNVKVARSRDGDNISHQSLLPLLPVTFKPETLLVNDSGTLLIVSGPSGVLVMELPARYPPYGAFDHNKELVYCRSYSLDERLLMCNDHIEVRRVRFHPGSPKDNHVVVLTSDNTLRLYMIENSTAVSMTTIQIGEKPGGLFPGTKKSYLAAFGEVGVDFDFGLPDVYTTTTTMTSSLIKSSALTLSSPTSEDKWSNLHWPAYIIRGDGSLFIVDVTICNNTKATVKGPIFTNTSFGDIQSESCSILCLNTNPQVIIVANSNGTLYHSIIIPYADEEPSIKSSGKELLCFESIELELGLITSSNDNSIEEDDCKYSCPIYLHKDESKLGRYFATHSTGIHSISITCLKDLQSYVNETEDEENTNLEDIFIQESKSEYLVCTKIGTTAQIRPVVVGFCLYYEPPSIVSILSDGALISLQILTTALLPKCTDSTLKNNSNVEEGKETTPLKKMLKVPFDQFIENIVKRNPTNQPIIKLGSEGIHSHKEAYEVLQRTSQVFRDYYFETNNRARDEIEKRIRTLQMMKDYQLRELERMNNEKQQLQQTAEHLAEKYEDIKDKQDIIMKRCEHILILVSQKKEDPSDAEKEFLKDIGDFQDKTEQYKKAIEKLKLKVKYQQLQIENWKEEERKASDKSTKIMNETHSSTIKTNLKDMSEKIAAMIKKVNEYKEKLNLK